MAGQGRRVGVRVFVAEFGEIALRVVQVFAESAVSIGLQRIGVEVEQLVKPDFHRQSAATPFFDLADQAAAQGLGFLGIIAGQGLAQGLGLLGDQAGGGGGIAAQGAVLPNIGLGAGVGLFRRQQQTDGPQQAGFDA